MNQNTNNQREKNLILISNPSDRFHEIQIPSFGPRLSSANSDIGNLFASNSSRQPCSNMNIFQTFKKDQKIKQEYVKLEQSILVLPQSQRYAQQCLQYQKYHFNDKVRLIIRRMSIKAYQNFREKTEHVFLALSIQKLFEIVAKKLLLNRFQLLFLQYVIQETKWKHDNEAIQKRMNQFCSYSQLSENQGQNGNKQVALKRLEIYLLFCGFYSKKSLNQFPVDNIFYNYLKSLCLRFKQNFTEWTQSSNVLNIKINPKVLNNIFKRLTFYAGREGQEIENYSLLVEEIIEISPAYNAQKGANKKKCTKRVKKQEEMVNQSSFLANSHIMQDMHENSESQISHEYKNSLQPKQEDEYSSVREQLPNLRNKKQTSYVSNVDGLDPEMYMREHSRMI